VCYREAKVAKFLALVLPVRALDRRIFEVAQAPEIYFRRFAHISDSGVAIESKFKTRNTRKASIVGGRG
jgi:hypothetical protein